MLFHLVTSVLESGIKSFGIKTKKISKGRQLPKNIRDMIQMKNFLCRKLQEAYISNHADIEKMSSRLEAMKRDIKTEISKVRLKKTKQAPF